MKLRNFYDILEIPENASASWILRAYQKRLLAVEQNGALKASARLQLIADINQAYQCLNDPTARAAHDAALAKKQEAAMKPSPAIMVLRIALLIGLPLAGAGAYVYSDHQAKARAAQDLIDQAAETQRLEARRQKIEDDRKAEESRDRAERAKAEVDRIEAQRLAHEEEMRTKRFVAAPTIEQIAKEKQAADIAARNQEKIDEMERIKLQIRAQVELERQKRFLRDAPQR